MNDTIDDLYTLLLADGIPAERDGKTIRYRTVRLRETTVADERAANRMAERVVPVNGVPKLLVSEADFQYALTMRHIEALECDGLRLDGAVLDLELFGKLTSHDLELLESRVFLVTMAAEVRYGSITQEQFDAYASGQAKAPAPQPQGQAAELGSADPQPVPGPALLTDYVRDDGRRAPAGYGL